MACGVSNNYIYVGNTFFTVGAIGMIVIVIANIASTIFAATCASKGEIYKYPLSINILKI